MTELIKVGFCVAYDWRLLKYSLPAIYISSDLIYLSIDKDRISWSGNKFTFDENGFRNLIEDVDTESKIIVLEDDFHIERLSPMENEVRQRNKLADKMGNGGWHIQLDCDEYFVEFDKFVKYLHGIPKSMTRATNICCPWIVLFKKTPEGFIYVDPVKRSNLEFMQIATKEPHYEYGRRNGNFNIHTNFSILHDSWARDQEEIKEKIFSWGHSKDFDKDSYLNFWTTVDETNFKKFKNIHWLRPEVWPRLGFLKATGIEELLLLIRSSKIPFPSFSNFQLYIRNSKLFSKIRYFFRILKTPLSK